VSRVWDEGRQLPPPARARLERHLAAAERTSGVPIYLLVTDRVYGHSAPEVAATAFAAHGLGREPARNAVLLAVAVRSGDAAIETGKGNAGIVPEVDARRIAGQLKRQLPSAHPERAIEQAITAVEASARATAARRTPLPPDPLAGATDDEPPPSAGDDADRRGRGEVVRDAGRPADGPNAERADASVVNGVLPGVPASNGRRSRLPLAIAVAVVVMLGLALRRRKQLTSSRAPKEDDRPRRF
jgi:hypothetical protein